MGTCMAPSYANILMGKLEKELLASYHLQPLIWYRYINDIFVLWTHGETQLQLFLDHINNYHHTIKFTADWSSDAVSFLDTRVSLMNQQLETDLYCKPTNTHQYLQWNSCHPRHCKMSIPYSQVLRIRWICSQDTDFHHRTRELREHLHQRGYDPQCLHTAIHQAASIPRETCLQQRVHNRDRTLIPLVVTHHPSLHPLRTITTQLHNLLQLTDRLKIAFPTLLIIAYHCPKNLRDLLVRADLSPPPQKLPGNKKCDRPRCKTCPTL